MGNNPLRHCVALGEGGNGARCTPPPVSSWDVEDKREGMKSPPPPPPRLSSVCSPSPSSPFSPPCPCPCSPSWVVDVGGRCGGCAGCCRGCVDVVDTQRVNVALVDVVAPFLWVVWPGPTSPRDVAASMWWIRGVAMWPCGDGRCRCGVVDVAVWTWPLLTWRC